MNNRGAQFAQAARGPILLITVGCLFALHQSGSLSFGRSWPLLIIVLGVMKLLERVLAEPQPFVPAGVPPAYPPRNPAAGTAHGFTQPGPPPPPSAGAGI